MFRFRKPKGPQPIPNKRDLLPRRIFRRGLRPMDERVLKIIRVVRPGLVTTALNTPAEARKTKAIVARVSSLVRREGIDDKTLSQLISTERIETFPQVLDAVEEFAGLAQFNRTHPLKKRL